MRRMLSILLVSVVPLTMSAQSHPLVGKWELSTTAMQIGSGGMGESSVTGQLVVSVVGDSLIAMLSMRSPDGAEAREALRLAGLRRDGVVSLSLKREMPLVSAGGAMRTIVNTTTYRIDVRGDRFSGEITNEAEGMVPVNGRSQMSGTRVR